ncbi:hypothetical protein AKJ36_02345 [candidate division MSBL1 archaeon SCGC-AAA259I07]|uniref:PIN domain-containing protein n=1 Tax=candidate division MSBL1 archaeon SCGC-AAA259I07 TaxID=1698266 RepID=A0A133UKK9_9EURY|nr:hypothetical protein AKJ36_02345 [candidate division MSBL1 archaeon SCGC-AAA259I07]
MLLVLDASVVTKWFKKEKFTDAALKIREEFRKGEHELIVPDLVLYEISNAMRYDESFTPEMIKDSQDSLMDMEMEIVTPTREILKNSVDIAEEREITIYDASYMALAELIEATLITADGKLFEEIKDMSFVQFISEFNDK